VINIIQLENYSQYRGPFSYRKWDYSTREDEYDPVQGVSQLKKKKSIPTSVMFLKIVAAKRLVDISSIWWVVLVNLGSQILVLVPYKSSIANTLKRPFLPSSKAKLHGLY